MMLTNTNYLYTRMILLTKNKISYSLLYMISHADSFPAFVLQAQESSPID
jgi:hypothetical protein